MKNFIRIYDRGSSLIAGDIIDISYDQHLEYVEFAVPEFDYIGIGHLEDDGTDAFVKVKIIDKFGPVLLELSLNDIDDVVTYGSNSDEERIDYKEECSIFDSKQFKKLRNFLYGKEHLTLLVFSDQLVFKKEE